MEIAPPPFDYVLAQQLRSLLEGFPEEGYRLQSVGLELETYHLKTIRGMMEGDDETEKTATEELSFKLADMRHLDDVHPSDGFRQKLFDIAAKNLNNLIEESRAMLLDELRRVEKI